MTPYQGHFKKHGNYRDARSSSVESILLETKNISTTGRFRKATEEVPILTLSPLPEIRKRVRRLVSQRLNGRSKETRRMEVLWWICHDTKAKELVWRKHGSRRRMRIAHWGGTSRITRESSLEKDPRELQISKMLTHKIGRSPFFYVIMNAKPGKGCKQPYLPKYDPVVGDLYLHVQEFRSKLMPYDDGALFASYSLLP